MQMHSALSHAGLTVQIISAVPTMQAGQGAGERGRAGGAPGPLEGAGWHAPAREADCANRGRPGRQYL